MAIDRTRLRDLVRRLAANGPSSIPSFLAELHELGAVRGANEGRTDMRDGDDDCVAWYAGQLVEVLEERALFAVNSIINCVDKFCPEVAP
jgi:hypothetical protein